MTRHVALLRGVNVGGKRKVAMTALSKSFASLGFEDVETYIQSGNVVFTSGRAVSAPKLEKELERAHGLETDVILRTASELEQVIAGDPYGTADRKLVHVGFLASAPAGADLAALDLGGFAPEEATIRDRTVYFHLPGGMGRAKLPPYILRKLGVPTTIRSWNTVTKLLEMALR